MKWALLVGLLSLTSACASSKPRGADDELLNEEDLPTCGGVRRPEPEFSFNARVLPDPDLPPLLLEANLALDGQPVKHMIPREQLVGTPVPMYIEPPPNSEVYAAFVRFRAFGNPMWRPYQMKKLDSGYAVEIPCMEVTVLGTSKFYIVLMDKEGLPIEALGSRRDPLEIVIKNQLEGGLPALPRLKPPAPCFD